MLSKLIITLATVGLIWVAASVIVTTNTKVELEQLDVRTKQAEINTLNKQIKQYEDDLKNSETDRQELERLKEANNELQRQLQARREAARNAAVAAEQSRAEYDADWVVQCRLWASQAGIPLDDHAIVLLSRESKCDPHVIYGGEIVTNYNGNLACGIPQSMPCHKLPQGTATPPTEQLRWFYNYVLARYGSYTNALAHSNQHGWY